MQQKKNQIRSIVGGDSEIQYDEKGGDQQSSMNSYNKTPLNDKSIDLLQKSMNQPQKVHSRDDENEIHS